MPGKPIAHHPWETSAPRALAGRGAVALLAIVFASACGSHRLARHDFAGRTLAVVHVMPTSADLRLDGTTAPRGRDDAETTWMAAPAAPAMPDAASTNVVMQAMLDSAARNVGLGAHLADRATEQAATFLGVRRVTAPSSADYVMDVRVRSYGLSTQGGDATPELFVEADVVLLDAATGAQVWATHVKGLDRLAGNGAAASGDAAAASRSTTSVPGAISTDDMERTLLRVIEASAEAAMADLHRRLRGRGPSHD